MKDAYIYFAVTVSGASVLAVEILGTRIIGPFYGVSLFLWSALISVTLAALSLGYAIGGRWADKGPRLERLVVLLASAGIWILLIPLLKHPVLVIAEPLGLRFAVLVAAFVLFFPPLALLGMISPYAIRLKASTLDVVGRTAGNLFAISTAASVFSALAVGFFLVPSVGVSRLTFAIGVLLILTAVIGFASARKARTAVPIVLLAILLAGASMAVAPQQHINREAGLLAIAQSPYAEIRVVEKDNVRYMLIDGGTHTIVDPDTWESLFPYVDVLDISKRFFEEPGNLLLVGLGGGSVVKRFARDGWEIDAVEIDPVVSRVAYEHFGLARDEADLFHMDGRQYLIAHKQNYNLIVMDAFGSSAIPFHLVTKESFSLIRSRLASDGVLAINIEAVGWRDVLVRSLASTLKQAFEHVLVLPIEEPPTQIGNLILLASDRELELSDELRQPTDRFGSDYNRVHAWDNRFVPNMSGVPVLTDDLNPVDLWAERINLHARKNLHNYFGSDGVSW